MLTALKRTMEDGGALWYKTAGITFIALKIDEVVGEHCDVELLGKQCAMH